MSRDISFALASFVGFTFASGAWFWGIRDTAFAVDDPGMVAYFTSEKFSVLHKIFEPGANRWRPVANFMYWLGAEFSGKSFSRWWMLNMLVMGVLCALVAMLLRYVSRSWLIGLSAGLLLLTSRFVHYQAVTTTGLVESVAAVLFVAMLFTLAVAVRTSARGWLAFSVVLFAVLCATHERWQGVGLFAIVIVLVMIRRPIRERFLWACAFALPVILINGWKKFVLEIPFAVGTGSATDVAFTWNTSVDHAVQGVAGVLGVNLGEKYLVGLPFATQNFIQQGFSLLVLGLSVSMLLTPFALGIVRPLEVGDSSIRRHTTIRYAFGFALFASVFLSVIFTSRLELRFLVGTYIVVLLAIGFIVRMKPWVDNAGKYCLIVVFVLFLVANTFMNFQYRKAMKYSFFREAEISAEARVWAYRFAREGAPNGDLPLYVVSNGSPLVNSDETVTFFTANIESEVSDVIVIPYESDIPASVGDRIVLRFDPATQALSGSFVPAG